MSVTSFTCPMLPLARAIGLLSFSPVLLLSPLAHAELPPEIIDGRTKTVDAATPAAPYHVINGGQLNVHGGTVFETTVTNNSAINVTSGTFTGRNGHSALEINNSTATIANAVFNGDFAGLGFIYNPASPAGAKGVITNSEITGVWAGVEVGGASEAKLVDSKISGTGEFGVGLSFYGGKIEAVGSQIRGTLAGARLESDTEGLGLDAYLVLDNSSVEGVAGPAIDVSFGGKGTIDVYNNSTLISSNGNLLEVREASTAAMNVANSHLEGNVQLTGNSTANLTFNQGQMTGDVLVEDGSTATVALNDHSQFTGRLDKVSTVAVNGQSNWTLTGNDTVGALTMDGGTVTFGAPAATKNAAKTYYQLNTGSLSGEGTFAIKADFGTGERDFLNVTGEATGNHGLLVNASGTDALDPQKLHVVHTAAGDAQFSLVGGRVDVGTWSYELANASNSGATDWYLDPTTKEISPGTRSVLALFNTAPTVWYGELSTLRSRMGELRFNGAAAGLWARGYGSKQDVDAQSGVAYKQTQQGFSIGADTALPYGDGNWLVGVLAGHSNSDIDVAHGTSGTVKSYYLGTYATWMDDASGYYFDGVVKLNRFDNEAKVGLSDGARTKGSYNNTGIGASAEVGRHIKLEDNYFVEPFAKLSAVVIKGKDYDLDNGMKAEGGDTRSLLGKLGVTAGRNFELSDGKVVQPYIRGAVVQEFAKNNHVQVNDNQFNNDLSGSRFEVGTGVAMSLSDKWQVHADFDFSQGDKIKQPWGANVGVRYNW
ncbi:autotransporter outer membrane beta-barrel domain-containing protein [Pseudomonas sp. Irchel 3E20]|uniref:autotransporter outer membrane beta-barrel domain-containing protein n=1 Tax=Pseudomonas sp. Irchel 3E20 TaxID=2008983 RepID=UPI000BA4D95A|nr:autotransporter outer membrane beta-barrel domain-containing protein [Pseudomonas sp. Irchel 3E20]